MEPIDSTDPFQVYRLALLSAALEGDAGTAFHLARRLMDDGVGFDEILFDVLVPVQKEVGRRWLLGDFRVAEEHAATAAVETLIASLAGFFDRPEEGSEVVVVCAEGETHALPGRLIATHLIYLGWRATFLGPSVPASDLETYLRETAPDALVLTCSLVTNLTGARASIRAAHSAGVPVLAGGSAFGTDGAVATALGADAWSADPREVDTVLDTWDPDIPAAENAAATPMPGLEDLAADRLGIVGAAAERLAARVSPETTAALRRTAWEDLALAFDALLGALTAADEQVLVEFCRWHRDHLDASEAAPGLATAILSSLDEVIDAPEAAAYLASARSGLEG
jgi:methanogenic corrinoid protein MtbC1